jgi:hypothetical protein
MTNHGATEPANKNNNNQNDNQRTHHLIYEGFAVIGAVATFVSIWPNSHLHALFLLAAALSLVSTYEIINSGRPKHFISLATASFFWAAFLAYKAIGPNSIPNIEVVGSLQPGNDPTPPNACDNPNVGAHLEDAPPVSHPPFALTIMIGGNVVARTHPGKFEALRIGQCSIISMEQNEKGIWVDADLNDETGKLIARITNNELHVMTGGRVFLNREDLSTLTIKNDQNDELLYVHYLNRGVVQVGGTFGCPGHVPVTVKENNFFKENCFYDIDAPALYVP